MFIKDYKEKIIRDKNEGMKTEKKKLIKHITQTMSAEIETIW